MAVSYRLVSPAGNPIRVKDGLKFVPSQAIKSPSLRCPHCLQMATFTALGMQDADIQIPERPGVREEKLTIGVRFCPNTMCAGVVFVLFSPTEVVSFPPEVLDFDPNGIPEPIVTSLEEAIQCHSVRCYRASALMVRRVLEELCKDRGAKGSNLKETRQSRQDDSGSGRPVERHGPSAAAR
jgi:hypothetical protein